MHITANRSYNVEFCSKQAGSFLLAGIVTFCLFVMMAKLIEQQGNTRPVQPPVFIDDFLLHVDEPVTNYKQPIKPMEKTLEQPPSLPVPVESEPGPSEISVNVNPVIPGTQIEVNTQIGKETNASARPIVRVNPAYPADAARQGIEGWVQLAFDISAQGTVTNIKVVDAEPSRIFDREARRALAKWRYQPQVEKGVPVAQFGLQVVLTFSLEQ